MVRHAFGPRIGRQRQSLGLEHLQTALRSSKGASGGSEDIAVELPSELGARQSRSKPCCSLCTSPFDFKVTQAYRWSLWPVLFEREPSTNKLHVDEWLQPTAHMFYATRTINVPDHLDKWEGYPDKSEKLS